MKGSVENALDPPQRALPHRSRGLRRPLGDNVCVLIGVDVSGLCRQRAYEVAMWRNWLVRSLMCTTSDAGRLGLDRLRESVSSDDVPLILANDSLGITNGSGGAFFEP